MRCPRAAGAGRRFAPGTGLSDASSGPLVSVIVPTFNEERELPATLDRLVALEGRWEVLLADGGSSDGTREIARRRGVAVIAKGESRAAQLNAAAAAASGEVLLFHHADSRLPANAYARLAAAAHEPDIVGGNFVLRFEGEDRFAFVMAVTYWLHRSLGHYYGDSSPWVRRELFERLGGFRPLPIMDDLDFIRRMERSGRTVCLPGPAFTSPRRWRAIGVSRTLFSWFVIRGLFWAGVPPERLAALYARVR